MQERIRVILEDLNPWWRDPRAPVPEVKPYRRAAFAEVHRKAVRFDGPRLRAVFVEGLRQVGKTSLARQVLDQALRDGLPGRQAAFVPLEDNRIAGSLTLEDLLEVWRPHLDRTRPALLVLDEVHNLHDESRRGDMSWARQVKSLVERNDVGEFRVRVLATASSASEVHDAAGLLVGRQDTIHVDVLSFPEFRAMRGTPDLERARDLDLYLTTGGFPELVASESTLDTFERIKRAIGGALAADVPEIRFPKEHQELFSILMDQSGEELNESALSKEIGVRTESIRRWMQRMEQVHLLHRVARWDTSEMRELRGRPKVYGVAPGIVGAFGRTSDPLSSHRLVGRLVEAAALAHLRPWARSRSVQIRCGQRKGPGNRRLGEVDFVLDGGDGLVLVEVTAGTANLEDKRAHVRTECERLRERTRALPVHGVVVHGGAARIPGTVPCVPLATFLETMTAANPLAGLLDAGEHAP